MRTLSPAAEASKLIRKDLKKKYPKIKFSVRCQNYSMGDNVDVNYTNGVPSEEINTLLAKYQYGHFNSMEDIYEHSNRIEGLPQTKHLFVRREVDPEMKQQVKKEVAEKWGIEDINNEQEWFDKTGLWSDQRIFDELQKRTF